MENDRSLMAAQLHHQTRPIVDELDATTQSSGSPPATDRHNQQTPPSEIQSSPSSNGANDQQSQTHTSASANTNNSSNGASTKNKKLFPQKLWDLINDDKYNFCLRWSDDGQLVYLNRDDFEDSYLKTAENQFHTQKAISFVRQMNMYGFRKVDDCYYENDNFKRDCEYLLKNMIRKHPNKNQNNEMSPYIYRHNNHAAAAAAAAAASTLLQSSAAASLLAPSHDPHQHHHQQAINHARQLNMGSLIDYRQRLNKFPIYGSNKQHPLNGDNSPSSIDAKPNDLDKRNHQHSLLEEERSNDDSLSSVGDYCCSAGSNQGDASSPLASTIDKTDADQMVVVKNHQLRHETSIDDRATSLLRMNQEHARQAIALFPHLGNNSVLESFPPIPLLMSNSMNTSFTKGKDYRGEFCLSDGSHQQKQPHEQSTFISNALSYDPFNVTAKIAHINELSAKQDTANGTDLSTMNQQQHNFQSLCNDQKELIRALMTQQLPDTQYPRDLTSGAAKLNSHHLGIQPSDNNNLNAFYALISSLNSNLYHPQAQIQAHQNPTFDMNRYLQNLYQQILTTSSPTTTSSTTTTAALSTAIQPDQLSTSIAPPSHGSNSTMVTQNSPVLQQQSLVPNKRIDGIALHTSASDKDSLSTSLLARNKFSMNATKSSRSLEMFENGYKNGCQPGERSHERIKDNKPTQQQQNNSNSLGKSISDSESLANKRRDVKTSILNRPFKRSVDSILDSNNNSNTSSDHPTATDGSKRMRIKAESEDNVEDNIVAKEAVNEYAKNLVAHVALTKDACIDPSVIFEASKFTQKFVETLFDTAQVIARHSNSSIDNSLSNSNCHSSSNDGLDLNSVREIERSNAINLNDLTSALKLLPSKILKLLN